MPLSRTLKPHATHMRRLFRKSALAGMVSFTLFITILLTLTWHKRQQQHELLLQHSADDLQQMLATLTDTLRPLQQYTMLDCNSVSRELTSRAAFADNIRAILLVRDGLAWCSSATGAFRLPVSEISPATELESDRDIRLLPGTPLLPSRPALALWLKYPGGAESGILTTVNLSLAPYQLLASYHPEITGMALVIGNNALKSDVSHAIPRRDLPAGLTALTLPQSDIRFVLYGSTLTTRDYQMTLLTGVLFALMIGCLTGVLLNRHQRPAREIMLAIRRGQF